MQDFQQFRSAFVPAVFFQQDGRGGGGRGDGRNIAGVGAQINIGGAVAVDFAHTGGIADDDLRRTAGDGLQRRDTEPLVERREKERFAVGHQRFGLTVGDIAEVEHVGQVGQPQALGLGGQATATRNGKYRVGLCLGRAQHPGEVLFFSRFAMLK